MNTTMNKLRHDEQGFTLVELAIVMVIIGLLIGGVLKGQEMITNTRVTATVAQAKGVDAAVATFRDMYNALPGDMTAVQSAARIPNCGAPPCNNNGNGNSRLGAAPGVAGAIAGENLAFWAHLNAADVLSGVDGSAVATWGQGLPAAPIGGGMTAGFSAGGGLGLNAAERAGHYITVQSAPVGAAGAAGTGAMSASQAARLDRKMDDGSPTTGSVFAAVATCGAGALYLEAADPQDCDLYIRIGG